jgi:HEPN domain-containing protein
MGTIGVTSGNSAAETLQWIRWADIDYTGARLLLLNGFVVQGTALANTAIEKYLKAVLSFSGLPIPPLHNPCKLYNKILATTTSTLALNKEFLGMLHRAYTIRYPDDLKEGFNAALNSAKILAELDRSVLEITSRFTFIANGKSIPMILDRAVKTNDTHFLTKNVAIDPSQAKELFSETSNSYEIRRHKGKLVEASYQTTNVSDDRIFKDGLVPRRKRK